MQTTPQKCMGCDENIDSSTVPPNSTAYCPKCNSVIFRGKTISSQGEIAIAIAALLLFFPSQYFPLVNISLLGQDFSASIIACTFSLFNQGFYLISALVFFCASVTPLFYMVCVLLAHRGLRNHEFKTLKIATWVLHHFKHWVMLDVFMVALTITGFKILDYAELHISTGVYFFLSYQFFLILLISKINIHRYWRIWQPEKDYTQNDAYYCYECHLFQAKKSHCIRCHTALHLRKPHSIQHSWTLIISALICLFPANLLSMTIIYSNGQAFTDTIFSGTLSLYKAGSYGIAFIIFTASIFVPLLKVVGLSLILLKIIFLPDRYQHLCMKLYHFIHFIGKWSMMDIFVIALMMTLLNRGQLLDFVPGLGATAFAMVVFFTMLATETLDTRLIWDEHD